jgi:hypothetical protein
MGMSVTIVLEQVACAVQDHPDGKKSLLFQDRQSGMVVHIPMSENDAKHLSGELLGSGVEIATTIPMNREQRRAKK